MSEKELTTSESGIIYIVTVGEYSDYTVLAAFVEKEAAEKWVAAMKADTTIENHYRYLEAEVAELRLVPSDVAPYQVTIFSKTACLMDDKTIEGLRSFQETYWAIANESNILGLLSHSQRPSVRYIRAPYLKEKGGKLVVHGRSLEAVEKVFNDKVMAWKAGSFGGPTCHEIIIDLPH